MSKDPANTDRGRIVKIGGSSIWTLLLGDNSRLGVPTVICFHGSGGGAESWTAIAHQVSAFARILLYDRAGQGRSTKSESASASSLSPSAELSILLQHNIQPPYVLVAHSYGGCIAREFLQQRNKDIAGIVLAETGQETLSEFEEQQYRKQILGKRPLSIIRANSLLAKQRELEQASAKGSVPNPEATNAMLQQWDAEDERLKKEQLKLSSNTRYVHVPDCGHNIVRDRPDIVAAEVKWVLEQWERLAETNTTFGSKAKRGLTRFRRLLGNS